MQFQTAIILESLRSSCPISIKFWFPLLCFSLSYPCLCGFACRTCQIFSWSRSAHVRPGCQRRRPPLSACSSPCRDCLQGVTRTSNTRQHQLRSQLFSPASTTITTTPSSSTTMIPTSRFSNVSYESSDAGVEPTTARASDLAEIDGLRNQIFGKILPYFNHSTTH